MYDHDDVCIINTLVLGLHMNDIKRDSNTVFNTQQPGLPIEYQQANDIGFQIPVDIVPLPSKGKTYPQNSPLHGLDKVEIRAMTAKEEDILMSRALIKKGTVISHLLRSCIVDKRINPEDLLSGDRNAIMIALRITGYGNEYPVEITCPACDHKEKYEFDLAELPIKFLETEPEVLGENIFGITLPVSKVNVRFKLLTGRDEEELNALAEAKKKKIGGDLDTIVTSRLQRSIVSVNGRSDVGAILNYIRNMPARDSSILRKYISEIEPGIEMKSDFTCSACGEQSEVNVPIGPTFFWPDT